ncbi:hypothetical protein ACGFIF_20185 [Kribbella sp. NPDC049174]|uniref:hypothetical protein n=1 Tax=Kribbella sp. NPDC049174 TaxID=3364112 RepID=UPI003716FA38
MPPSRPSPHPPAAAHESDIRTAVPVFHQRLNRRDDTRNCGKPIGPRRKPGCFERLDTTERQRSNTEETVLLLGFRFIKGKKKPGQIR